MRLSEEEIKQAILHPQLEIRQRAVRYFSNCYSEDESIVPLVIQAVKKYGREDAYHLVGGSVDLRHTEETISWVIEELQDPEAERYENYVFNLNCVLCHTDPILLIHRDTEILETCHLDREMVDHFTRRLELLSWDEAACWQRLETICEEGKDKQYVNEVDLSFANDILEALARNGDEVERRVLTVLSQKIENFEHNPMKWMEPLMVGKAKDYFVSDEPGDQKESLPTSNPPSLDETLLGGGSDTESKRVGRNDPCPCGSGKKYKKCCMRKQHD